MGNIPLWERDGAGIHEMRQDGEAWEDIGNLFHCTADAARKRHKTWLTLRDKDTPPPPDAPTISGNTIRSTEIDTEKVWKDALKLQEKAKKRIGKDFGVLEWTHGPVAIVAMADLHLGGYGVDYSRLDDDISMILGTPGMYVVLVGDMLDNFIIGKLQELRKTEAHFTVTDEWALVKHVLKRLAPRLVASCSGNHDLWTYALSGIDYLADLHEKYNPDILYHKYDLRFQVCVGEATKMWRVRHSWRGYSQFNDLHAQQKASKFDKGVEWDVAVGAHTHTSGLFTEFNNGGVTGYAVQCGSYKIEDTYAVRLGLPKANESACVTTIVHDDGFVHGTNNLAGACKIMNSFYRESS